MIRRTAPSTGLARDKSVSRSPSAIIIRAGARTIPKTEQKVTATGTVKKADGKLEFTATKIELTKLEQTK